MTRRILLQGTVRCRKQQPMTGANGKKDLHGEKTKNEKLQKKKQQGRRQNLQISPIKTIENPKHPKISKDPPKLFTNQ